MTIQAWTFLISRNQSIDYKTVVAPDFISDAKIRSLLAKSTEEDFTESGRISIREVKGSEVGNFTVVFRSIKARSKDIGEDGNEVLKDPFGREIYWIEGLVFRKNLQEIQYKIGESHLDRVHRDLQEKYREFWHEDKLSISHVIDLIEVASEPDNQFRVLEPLVITSKPQFPESRPPEKYGRKYYPSSKSVRSKTNLFRFVMIAITALLLTGFLWSRLADLLANAPQQPNAPQSTNAPQQPNTPQSTITCLYTQYQDPKDVLSGIEKLKNLQDKHKTTWIFLTGSLKMGNSLLVDRIKHEIDSKDENTKKILTITTAANGNKVLKFTNYPIVSAIELLQNEKFTSDDLYATIIEVLPIESSCNTLQKKVSIH